MLQYGQIIGKKEDWSNVITNVEMFSTPVLSWLPIGEDFNDPIQFYQAEKFADPVRNIHIDGKPVTDFIAAGQDRGELSAFMQYSSKAAAITKVHQELGNIAGIPNSKTASGGELGREMVKKLKELSRDIETNILSNFGEQKDNTNVGWATRAIPVWVQTGTTNQLTGFETPVQFRPPSASIDTTATASMSEDIVLNILQSIGGVTRDKGVVTAICAPTAKRLFNNMPMFLPIGVLAGTSNLNAGANPNPLRGQTYDRVIERYNSDFGPVDLMLSWWNHYLDTTQVATMLTHSVYFLHRDMWEFNWKLRPDWVLKAPQGGGYEAFCETFWRIRCLNPKGEGAWKPQT